MNCQCKWLSALPTARETFVNSFPSTEKFFCTGRTFFHSAHCSLSNPICFWSMRWMGTTKCSFARHISASAGQREEVFYSALSTYQQHLRQEERHYQEAHPHSPCHHDFPRSWLGCRWLQWYCMAAPRQRQPQHCWRSNYGQYLAYATGPHTTVGTWIHSGHLARRLWISQTTWLSAILESEQARRLFRSSQNPWSTSHRSKLPSRNVAAPGFCWLEQHTFQEKYVRATHFIKRTTRGWCLWKFQATK